jgi:hypothetical protein
MTLPAIYGAGAVSAGVALIVDYAYPGLGWAVFLVCSGGFALIVDHRVPEWDCSAARAAAGRALSWRRS